MLLAVFLLAGCCLALPTPENEEKDGEVSRKILGSSVVTSVSVIMDVSNGSQAYFSDAVGKPMTKPSAAAQLASPINLLNPDRYEFYTFDDSGDLVKRLMTLDEIQGIIASGDGEATNYNSQSLTGDGPEKRVDDVVNNVQNVLKEEMAAHKTAESKPMLDTADVTSSWSMILPAIFGNSGNGAVPGKQPNVVTAETIMIEPTTLLPVINDSSVGAESSTLSSKQTVGSFTITVPDVTTEVTSKEAASEKTSPEEIDTPIITVEITSDLNKQTTGEMMHDEAPDSKTESLFLSENKTTTNMVKNSESMLYSNTALPSATEAYSSRPAVIISTPSPFTAKAETPSSSSAIPLSSTTDAISTTSYTTSRPSSSPTASPSVAPISSSVTPTTSPSIAPTAPTIRPTASPSSAPTQSPKPTPTSSPSTIQFYRKTSPPPLNFAQPQSEMTTPHGQLSTFFLIEDYKHKPESTTKLYSTPAPFTPVKPPTIEDNYQSSDSTTKLYVRLPSFTSETKAASTDKSSTVTEPYPSTTEDIAKEDNKAYVNLDSTRNTQEPPSTRTTVNSPTEAYSTLKLSSTDSTIFSATEELITSTTKPYPQTSTAENFNEGEENVRFSTHQNDLPQSTTENLIRTSTLSFTTVGKQTQQTEQPSDSEFTKLVQYPTEKFNDTEKEAVTELLNQLFLTTNVYQINSELLSDTSASGNGHLTTESVTTTDKASTTKQTTLSINTEAAQNATSRPEKFPLSTTDLNLVSSIEQIISQAIDNPEQLIENVKEGEKVNQVILNTDSKPMSEVQTETATAASALIGTPNSETAVNITLGDEKMNQAVGSLISQVINQQPIQPIEGYSTTDNIEKYTTENDNDQTTMSNSNESNTKTDITSDERNRYEEIDLESLDSSTMANSEGKTVQPPLPLSNKTETDYTSEIPNKITMNDNQITKKPAADKITFSTELNRDETRYQSTTDLEIFSTTEKLNQNDTLSTQKSNEELIMTTTKVPSKTDLSFEADNQNVSKIPEEEISTSTENLNDTTGKSNEILNSEASELNQENYNGTTENSSEPFLIIASSSEYPDYASTEIINVYTKNTEYDSTTSEEHTGSTEISTDAEINTHLLTENLPGVKENTEGTTIEDYQTTQVNLVSEPQPQTPLSLENRYQITKTNIASELFSQTTQDNFSNTQLSTEKVTLPTTQESIAASTTQQPFVVSTTQQPLASTTLEPLIVSTTQRPIAVSTTQQPFTVSINQQQFVSTTQAQPSTTVSLTQQQTTVPSTVQQPTTAPIIISSSSTASPIKPALVTLPTVTAAPKTEKPAELKLVINNTATTTPKPDMTWTLVSTVLPHKTPNSEETKTPPPNRPDTTSVDLVPKPLQGFGLEDSTSTLDADVFQFTELCNELAFSFWSSVTSGISFARSVIVSPFAATSMLAMVFLGARGATSGEMNEILKLDDMVTFNPHTIFKNVIESIEVSKKSGVAVSVFVKELYSDKNKGKLLSFYKERVKQFYDGHVEEANFKEINDVIRRRTNLLVKRQTWGKIPEYLRDNNLFVRPPLAAVSANIFQTDCSEASTEGRDGELHFVVLPSIRQRKLVPIPAVVWRSGFLAGYDPGLDATAVAVGTKDQSISTIFVIPGQQGISAPGDGLMRLEARLLESAFRQGSWSRLLRSLIPRPGLEVQIPRFSHKSVINATTALKRMGLKDLFNSNTADLKGLNGVAHELYLSDIIQVNTFATCGEGRIDETHHSEVYPATTNRSFRRIRKIQHYHSDKPFENSDILEEPRDYQRAFHDPLYDPSYLSLPLQLRPRQARLPDAPRLRFDRPFIYFVRHNPTGLILHMGRFNPRLLP